METDMPWAQLQCNVYQLYPWNNDKKFYIATALLPEKSVYVRVPIPVCRIIKIDWAKFSSTLYYLEILITKY